MSSHDQTIAQFFSFPLILTEKFQMYSWVFISFHVFDINPCSDFEVKFDCI